MSLIHCASSSHFQVTGQSGKTLKMTLVPCFTTFVTLILYSFGIFSLLFKLIHVVTTFHSELTTQIISHIFLRLYKNKVDEVPGWNDQVLRWCMEAAREKALRKEDYWRGFVIDEMKIQVRILNLLNIIPIQKYLHNP